MATSYILRVRGYVNGRRVDGEYDGGKSLKAARTKGAEMKEWVESDPHSSVNICRASREGTLLLVVEHVHG